MNHSLTPTRLDSSNFRILIGKNCRNLTVQAFSNLRHGLWLTFRQRHSEPEPWRKEGFYHG